MRQVVTYLATTMQWKDWIQFSIVAVTILGYFVFIRFEPVERRRTIAIRFAIIIFLIIAIMAGEMFGYLP